MEKALRNTIIFSVLLVSVSWSFSLIYGSIYKDSREDGIHRVCASWSLDEARARNRERQGVEGRYDREQYDHYFERCLREKGL